MHRNIKIHILFPFTDNPHGGANQFLKALRNKLILNNQYAENIHESDVIILNSYPFRNESLFFKAVQLINAGKVLIHRIDGPISLARERDVDIDRIIYYFNKEVASGTVFQSKKSKELNLELGMKLPDKEVTISNAPDSKIFNNINASEYIPGAKLKIIASSWSANKNKGFEVFSKLDEILDFTKYDFYFIGNTSCKYKNIKHINALPSDLLAEQLKACDVYLMASKVDACPNALIEAMSCGLPAVVFNSGAQVDIIGKAGEVFNIPDEIPGCLEKIANNYDEYVRNINVKAIDNISDEYYQFCKLVYDSKQNKNVSTFVQVSLFFKIVIWRIKKVLKLN